MSIAGRREFRAKAGIVIGMAILFGGLGFGLGDMLGILTTHTTELSAVMILVGAVYTWRAWRIHEPSKPEMG
jgi:hypothetical protein